MSWKDFLNNKEDEQPQKEGRGMDQKSVAKPPVLFSETQQVLKAVEAKLGGTLITYYNSNAGSVCGNDASAMYEILKGKKIENAFLFIKSDGGSGIFVSSAPCETTAKTSPRLSRLTARLQRR